MKCTNCGNEIPEGKKFCKFCGASTEIRDAVENPSVRKCKKCGAPLKDGYAFCDQCGAPIEDAEINGGDSNNYKSPDKKGISLGLIISVILFIVLIVGIGIFVYRMVKNNRMGDLGGEDTETAAEEYTAGTTVEHDAAESASTTAEQQNESEVSSDVATQKSENEASSAATTQQNKPEAPSDTITDETEINTITPDTSAGDFVYYGAYEQNNNIEDGKERLEWLVLDEEDGRYLLITSEVIDNVCYNNEWKDINWENCSLRVWLNTSFLEEVFTENQIDNIAYSEHTDRGGNNTSDQVFIMNTEELEYYFNSNDQRIAGATPYAKDKGVYVYDNGNCWWWVSDAGADPHYARYVNCEGAILEYGMLVFNNAFGVRPAIWVKK